MEKNATVQMKGITKQFATVLANDAVDFTAYQGEIHALLGENGAGKSTLMNILTGVLPPDGGQIFIRGKEVSMQSPKDAIALEIGMIYQHFKLIKPFTVAENIVLGMPDTKVIKKRKLEKRVKELSESYGIDIKPDAPIWQLSIGEQQRVEILKVLYRNANILILDEPTAVLTDQEVQELFATLRKMTSQGCTVIFITHKMHEVMAFADRITVLRDGRLVKTLTREQTDEAELAHLMVGREISSDRRNTEDTTTDRAVLSVRNFTVRNDKKLVAVNDLSFDLYAGEILGIAGVSGNGQKELMEALAGLRPSEKGTVQAGDTDITKSPPIARIRQGMAFIPEDRYGYALIRELSVADNASMKSYADPAFCKYGIVNYRKLTKQAEDFIEKFEIKTGGTKSLVQSMSGGNAQKLILARETARSPKIVLASYPVRGLDIKATESIHQILINEKARGAGVLLVSEDLEEIFQLCDRVAVMYEGRFMGVLPYRQVNLENIGLAMSGACEMVGESDA